MKSLGLLAGFTQDVKAHFAVLFESLSMIRGGQLSPANYDAVLHAAMEATSGLEKIISTALDYARLDGGNFTVHYSEGNLVSFVERIVKAFAPQAVEKNIQYRFHTSADQLFLRFDSDTYGKILNQLLLNALQNTPMYGWLSVNLSVDFDEDSVDADTGAVLKKYIVMSVMHQVSPVAEPAGGPELTHGGGDSDGPPERNDFNAYADYTGHSVGFAWVKEFAKLCDGQFLVTQKPGKWVKLMLQMPWQESAGALAASQHKISDIQDVVGQQMAGGNISPAGDAPLMLIVEDNLVMQMIIRYQFESTYQVYVADDGEQGWQAALEKLPDIIISDVLMPVLDGYGLLKRLKSDERTSHIPVILLTALESKENKLEGLTIGADDFITKPFDIAILQTKVENVLAIRKALRKKYAGEVYLRPRNIIIEQPDERFLNRVIGVIEENIADADLDIETFAREVGVSRMQLYRKMHALTGMTVKEYIRHFRMLHAEQLIKQRQMTLSEIAYAVGFNDVAYFRKYFKQQFGVNPSEYIKKGDD